jgi:ADP-ribosylglycohydrolase
MDCENLWLSSIMGLVVGDALGVPVEFKTREELQKAPVTTMQGYGTYNLPAGTWSDDSSMTMATLRSLLKGYNADNIMQQFIEWYKDGAFTPYGELFDIGISTETAIRKYIEDGDIHTCGGTSEFDNGNGSLMRILPVCLYCICKDISTNRSIYMIHEVSGLTHNHIRSKIACGLYLFLINSIVNSKCISLESCLQNGINAGFYYYSKKDSDELSYYNRLKDLNMFKMTNVDHIQGSSYVVSSLEAAIWCLLNTDNYKDCVLKAVNLGQDTDTVAAIAGGLAGSYYGYENIPNEWIETIPKNDWIQRMCCKAGRLI